VVVKPCMLAAVHKATADRPAENLTRRKIGHCKFNKKGRNKERRRKGEKAGVKGGYTEIRIKGDWLEIGGAE